MASQLALCVPSVGLAKMARLAESGDSERLQRTDMLIIARSTRARHRAHASDTDVSGHPEDEGPNHFTGGKRLRNERLRHWNLRSDAERRGA